MDKFITTLTNIFCIEPEPLAWELGDTIYYATEVAVYPVVITKPHYPSLSPEHSIFQTRHNATQLLNKRKQAMEKYL